MNLATDLMQRILVGSSKESHLRLTARQSQLDLLVYEGKIYNTHTKITNLLAGSNSTFIHNNPLEQWWAVTLGQQQLWIPALSWSN